MLEITQADGTFELQQDDVREGGGSYDIPLKIVGDNLMYAMVPYEFFDFNLCSLGQRFFEVK